MTSPSPSLLRDKRREHLLDAISVAEDEAKTLNSRILSLRSQVNSLSLISLLSVETFQEIFLILALPSHEEQPHRAQSRAKWDWCTVTKVCKHWRDVALGYPRLWSVIHSFVNADKIAAFLQRSRTADLVVTIGRFSSSYLNTMLSDTIGVYAEGLDRVKELRLLAMNKSGIFEKAFPVLSRRSLPRLRVLELSFLDAFYHRQYMGQLRSIASNTSLYDLQLRELILYGFPLDWNHSVLRGLTVLNIKNVGKPWQPTLMNVLDILEQCPNLESLIMQNSGPEESPGDTIEATNARPVHLQYLRTLEIIPIDASTCLDLFRSLQIPPRISCRITLENYSMSNPTSIHPLLIECTLGDAPDIEIDIQGERMRFIVSAHGEENINHLVIPAYNPRREVPPSGRDICNYFESLMAIFGESIRSRRSVLLDLSDAHGNGFINAAGKNGYAALYDQIPQIAYLEIVSSKDHENTLFLQALVEIVEARFRFPNLSRLTIKDCSFARRDRRGGALYAALLENLVLRGQLQVGRKVEILELINCGMDQEEAARLLKSNVCKAINWTEGREYLSPLRRATLRNGVVQFE